MDISTFNDKFFNIAGDILELRLIDTYEGEDGALPFYWWDIILKSSDVAIGKISFRIGHNYHSYYNGNIGYEIDEEYRGNHYALTACRMVLELAEYYNMDKLYLTCDYDNIASYNTIEKLGGRLIEEVCPPRDYIYYYEGMSRQRIYELNIPMRETMKEYYEAYDERYKQIHSMPKVDIQKLTVKYKVRKLNETDIDAVYKVMRGNPLYFQHCPPMATHQSILDDMKALPPQTTYDDKCYMGFFQEDCLVAVMDLILNFPNKETAFIGFFMVNKEFQGKGLGTEVIKECFKSLKTEGYQYIRLGFAKGNPQSEAFWMKNGFERTGVEDAQERYTVVVLQKEL